MRAAMAAAEVGDDVYGDDPTVNRLQAQLAERLGFSAGLFFPSGTQSNLCAMLAHCQRGDAVILGQRAHTYEYEQGGAAVFGSVQLQPIPQAADGRLPLEQIAAAIKPRDPHFAHSRLLALENTIGGKVLPAGYVQQATRLAREHGLATHLDGARLFNAIVAQGLHRSGREREAVAGFDSVSVCLSKGLGAPVGSLLLGSAALIQEARHWRKGLGGGLRQAGVLAAAGLYALEHHVARLDQDHQRAKTLALALVAAGYSAQVHTNMVFVQLQDPQVATLQAHLQRHRILARVTPLMRLVLHLDIDDVGLQRAIDAFSRYMEASA